MSDDVFASEITIESVTPVKDEALKVVIIIPKENYEAQKHALEAFFNRQMRDLSQNPRAQGPKDEAG